MAADALPFDVDFTPLPTAVETLPQGMAALVSVRKFDQTSDDRDASNS